MGNSITYETVQTLAVLRESNGYTKELRIVAWNGAEPKLDLHEWKPEGRCGRGLTLTDEEGRLLLEGLKAYFEGR